MQTTVSASLTNAFPGMDGALSTGENITRLISTQQLDLVRVVTNTNGTFAITVDAVEEASFVALSNSIAQIAAGLLADWSGNTNSVDATAYSTTGLYLENSDEWDTDGHTTAVTLGGASNAAITVSTLVDQGETCQAGIGLCTDDYAATSGTQCRKPRQATDITARFLGISRADTALEASSAAVYTNQMAVSIKRKGTIWVRVEDAVAEMGVVYCRYSTPSTNYGLGSFRSDADSAKAAIVPNAIYMTAASAGGLALVELS